MLLFLACASPPAPTPPPAEPPGHHAAGHHAAGDHATMTHRFEDAAKWATVFDDPTRDAWQKPAALVEALHLAPGATVADIGAGTGYFEGHLAKAVGPAGRVVAVDLEPDMVRYLAERAVREGWANVEARQGAAADPGLRPGEVDLVLLVDTYHHLDARVDWFTRLRTTLKPGGRLVIVDFDPASDDTLGPPKAHRLAPDVVTQELGAAGWRVVDRPALLPHQYVLVAEGAAP